jgi:hypothetical protein
MYRSPLSFVFFLLVSFCSFSQTFTGTPTINPSAPYCAGANITVNWAISGSFNPGNIFTVQLGVGAGFASIVNLGTINSQTATSLSVTIPFSQAQGNNYRIRITGSNPVVTSAQSATFTINAPVTAAPTYLSATLTGTTFCAGATFNIDNVLTNGCNFNTGNTFTVQLGQGGGFTSPVTIGTFSGTTGGAISVTIPFATATNSNYRIRVNSSDPASTGTATGNFNINAPAMAAPTVAGSPFCVGASFNITNNLSGSCLFDPTNTFTAQLSDATGSFASPVVIGSVPNTTAGGSIPVTIPLNQAAGTQYRIRIVSTNPAITGPNNGANLTIRPLLLAPTVPAPLCQGATFNITNNLSAGTSCSFNTGNTFTVQLSNSSGSFASPTTIGTALNTTAGGPISVTIPFPTTGGTGYRIRVVGSDPVVTGPDNGVNLTVSDFGINAPTFTGTSFCPGQALTVNYTLLNSCTFPNTPANNVFTAQLSDSFGSFTSPTNIGSVTSNVAGSIATIIPTGAIAGTGYRIRVISSNPSPTGVIGTINGTNLTINAINLNAPTFAGTTFCPGATFILSYTLVNACSFFSGNTFTAQLSDASGSFTTPANIGSAAATGAGNFSVTIPTTTPAGTAYRIRVVASNPAVTSPINASALTVNAFGINAPTITGGTTSFCQGQAFTLNYTIQNGCNFPNTPSNNIFTAQLSNATGSFAAPTNIGTITSNAPGAISATIPGGTPAGTGYRVRVISSNPGVGVIGTDNGANLTVSAAAGDPTIFGNNIWNAYLYRGTNATITNNTYLGFYTENTLNFNTTTRWANNAGPATANSATGAAYTGCPNLPAQDLNYSMSFKRTNFTCGYYQIDIPSHDDDVRVFVNGVNVFTFVGCCAARNNVWRGFLNASSTVEFQFINFSGPGNLQVALNAAPNPLTVSPNLVQCSAPTTPGTLSVSSPLALNYAWTPTTGLTPASGLGASVVAAPSITTTYTVTGTDAATGCSVTNAVTVTVSNSAPTIVVSAVPSTICSGVVTSTLTASGASNYSWSPGTGLSATTGSTVIANPLSTQTYTVTGNNGCTGPGSNGTANTTVTVQTIPGTPPLTGLSSFGNNTWNVFAHYNNTTFSNFYGYYTENNLSFNTTSRWGNTAGPSVANAASGLAYTGCTFVAPNVSTNYSLSYRRTNFTCGYYQVNINSHDDALTMLVDGVQVFQNNTNTPTLQTNVWTGFLGPNSTVEFRLINNGGPGQLQTTFLASPNTPQTVSPDVTICAGTNTGLTVTAAGYPSATYTWSVSPAEPTVSFVPNNTVTNPFFQTTGATPAGVYTISNVLTDVGGTGCTATATRTITVDPLPNTQVTPTSATISCPTASVTLTASGANTYTWSPAAGLSAVTGFSVVATPTVTTTYTVTGSNNCAVNSATSTITVIPLPAITTFPTGTWNVYGFNSQTIGTNYQGYYTENGSGPTGLSFDTRTRWPNGGAPSAAVTTANGNGWLGCAMNTSNISISAKRTGFACGVYQLDVPAHDDDFYLLINGVQVARHNGCCDTHTNVWTGVLNANSTVEWQMQQGGGGSYLQVAFTLISQPAGTTVWAGGTSNDWFDASNWCGGVPTTINDALIPAAGPQNMPLINNAGAVTRNITINPSIAATGGPVIRPTIPAASLTTNTFNLDVNGNWINDGTLTPNTGSISFVGSGVGNTISTSGTQTFNNIVINKTSGITMASGTTQISGSMTFTNGLVTQSGTFRFLNGSSAVGANNNSYVIGVVTKVGSNAFTFPVGASNLYRPIAISAPTVATDTYTAQYINSNPSPLFPNAARAVTLDRVSGAEYWLLNRTVGTSNVNVTLSWNSNSGGIGNPPALRVAAWNGSLWTDQGNGGTTGTLAAGTIVTGAPSPIYFGPYTLAGTDNSNPLPVELIDFTAKVVANGFVNLEWKTASELNNDFFTVQRSVDGAEFANIAQIKGAGTIQTESKYEFTDEKPLTNLSYYRLRQTDFDKKSSFSKVIAINVGRDDQLSLYPNPVNRGTLVTLNRKGDYTIVNNLGVIVLKITDTTQIDVSALQAGIYSVRSSTGEIIRLVVL